MALQISLSRRLGAATGGEDHGSSDCSRRHEQQQSQSAIPACARLLNSCELLAVQLDSALAEAHAAHDAMLLYIQVTS